MTHTYAAYKRPTSKEDLHRLKVKGWKQIFQANGQEKKKAEIAILIFDKIDFKTKAIKRDSKGHFIYSRQNPSRRHKYCKHICTQHRSTQIYKGNLGGLQERYRHQHTYSRGF